MKKLQDIHPLKVRELKRKYIMPDSLEEVLIEDNTIRPYMEGENGKKTFLPLRKMGHYKTNKENETI
jgi:hypothetical protein